MGEAFPASIRTMVHADAISAARLREAAIWVFGPAAPPAPRGGLPKTPGVWQINHGGRAHVLAVRLADGTLLAAKFYHDRRLGTRVRNRLGFGKWRRIPAMAAALTQRQIPHAQVLGYAEADGRGAIFMEYLQRHDSVTAYQRRSPVAPDRLASALGRFAARLHEAGVTHRDFSLRNLLLAEIDGRLDIRLADLEDVRLHPQGAPLERSYADLQHLNLQLPPGVSLPLRLRFLARYRRVRRIAEPLRELKRRFIVTEEAD